MADLAGFLHIPEKLHWTKNLKMTDSNFTHKKLPHGFQLRLILAAVIAVCVSLSGCTTADSKQQKAQAAGSHSVSVAVATVQQQDVPVYLVGLGSVSAFYTANIKSRVDGQIMRVNFQEGQVVKEGDLLILIDPRPYQVQP